jgi:hypothetical protein
MIVFLKKILRQVPALTSLKIAGIAVLALIVGIMVWKWKTMVAQNDQMRLHIEKIEAANTANQVVITQYKGQLIALEKTYQARCAHQDRLRKKLAGDLKAVELKLRGLQGKYDEIATFLAMPLPPSFVDNWMRAPVACNPDEDRIRLPADVLTGTAGDAGTPPNFSKCNAVDD